MPIPLSFLDEASVADISSLRMDELSDLSARLQRVLETQERRKRVLAEALRSRFGEKARELLNADGKDTGTTRFWEQGTQVIAQFRKKVEWDQEALHRILKAHPEFRDAAKATLSIEEKRYSSWPAEVQKIFEPARSVKVASCDFSLKTEEEPEDV